MANRDEFYEDAREYLKQKRHRPRYVDYPKVINKELLAELLEFKKTKIASERLGYLFICLVNNYAKKGCWSGYSWNDEMIERAILFLLQYSRSFNPEKSTNAFAYCTSIVHNAFLQVIKKEKKLIEDRQTHAQENWHKEQERVKRGE